uniref:AAA family ATPase n=1 Tax=Candidatus Ruminimicrobium bovinum TaxID=3242779 RepID=UPI0039B86BA2
HIIAINLENDEYENLYDRTKLREYIKSKIKDKKQYYLFLDEIQNVENFEKMLNGGMPYTLSFDTTEEKSKYLKDLFKETFIKDIIDRYKIQKNEVLDTLTNILASSIGSLTNPNRITDTFVSKGYKGVSNKTDDEDKKEREIRPYFNIDDNFTKIIVTKNSPTYRNEDGVLIIGLKDFLLNQNIFDKII